jgi:hypothetical protein
MMANSYPLVETLHRKDKSTNVILLNIQETGRSGNHSTIASPCTMLDLVLGLHVRCISKLWSDPRKGLPRPSTSPFSILTTLACLSATAHFTVERHTSMPACCPSASMTFNSGTCMDTVRWLRKKGRERKKAGYLR